MATAFMSAFHKGRSIRCAGPVKNLAAIACSILPLFLAAYTGLEKNHSMAVSSEDMGIIVAFLTGAIGAISTVITSPKVGLSASVKDSRIPG